MKSRLSKLKYTVPAFALMMGHSGVSYAQSAPLVNVCSGISIDIPILTPVVSAASGLLGGLLDPVLNTLVGGINTNLVGALSGQNIGATVLDTNGNLLSTPGDCGLTADSVQVDANAGISLGGGSITGLGGPGNTLATAGEINSIAVGNGAATSAAASNSIALGLRGTVTATDGIALGRDTSVSAAEGVALGSGTTVSAIGGVALGAGSVADRAGMNGQTEAFSGVSVASTAGAISVGSVGGERQITNVAGGTADTDAVNVRQLNAVDDKVDAVDNRVTVVNNRVDAVDNRVTVVNNKVDNVANSVATAVGGNAYYDSVNNVFVGPTYNLRGGTYTNIGDALTAIDVTVGAIAADNTAGAPAPTATGANAVAVAYGATASGSQSTAIGSNATASGANSTAVGSGSSATYANSTAVGAGATTTRANQVAIGTASNTYTLPGISSAASRAAQSGPTKLVTSDAAGNLATTDVDLNKIQNAVVSNRREMRRGVAAAMAMSSAPTPSAPGKTTWATNVAQYHGEFATSFAVAHMLDTEYPVTMNAALSFSPGEGPGVRLGLAGEF